MQRKNTKKNHKHNLIRSSVGTTFHISIALIFKVPIALNLKTGVKKIFEKLNDPPQSFSHC